jgi:hypothetical protein
LQENAKLVIQPQSEPDTLKGSLQAEAAGQIGAAKIQVNYYSPAVRGRIVWGGLVPYDQVWVTGAHMATNLLFDQTLTVGGQSVPAGKYAFFTIPGQEEWTVIINRNWEQHLADKYDPKDDIVRVKVKPETLGQNQERLRYEVNAVSENAGEIVVSWEKQRIMLPVSQ